MKSKILVEVSNRHVHLSREDIDLLFGKGYKLRQHRALSQPGQFAAKEKINLINSNTTIENVRVLGPERKETQVELSKTDAIYLKINPPLRNSGDLKSTPGIILKGPKDMVELKKGVIIIQRHLHASEKEAKKLGIKDGEIVSIKIPGQKETIFNNILARVGPKHKLAVHLDTDEGNAADIAKITFGELLH